MTAADTARRLAVPRAAALVLAGVIAAGCQAPPVARWFGLDRVATHHDIPAPATLDGAVRALALAQARRVVVHDRASRAQAALTDPQQIAAVLDVLRTSQQASGDLPQTPPASVRLDIVMDRPARTVSLYYDAARHTVLIYNTPTDAWPNHIVSTYPVPPAFGARLQGALAPPQAP